MGWLCWTAVGLWWMEWRQPLGQSDGVQRTVAFDPAILDGVPLLQRPPGKVLVVSLTDLGCACADAGRAAALKRRFVAEQVWFQELPRPGPRSHAPERQDPALAALAKDLWARVPAVPAALVLAPDGALAYLGPWVPPAWCSTGSGDLLERAIAQSLEGRPPRAPPMLATGCFCAAGSASSALA